jgi:hypothetical protein
MGKSAGSKQTVDEKTTMDPAVQQRLFGVLDDVSKYTAGMLPDNAPSTAMAPRTDTFKAFLDSVRSPSVTSADFRGAANDARNQPTMSWKPGQASVATIGNWDAQGPTAIGTYNSTGPTQMGRFDAMGPTGVADYGDIETIGVNTITGKRGKDFMGDYNNAFSNDVINATIGDLNKQRGRAQVQSNMAAAAAGAAGGSRQGIRDAEVQDDYNRTLANTVANLRKEGFDTAAMLGQTDAGRLQEADRANQDITFQAATKNAELGADKLARVFSARNTAALSDADREATRRSQVFGATNQINLADKAREDSRLAAIFGAENARNITDAQRETLRRQGIFDATNNANESNATRQQNQGQFDQTGTYRAGMDTANLRNDGLKMFADILGMGSDVDVRNLGLLGTGAQMDQSDADARAGEWLEALKLRMSAAGLLPNLTSTSQTTRSSPGLFDWLGLGAKVGGSFAKGG